MRISTKGRFAVTAMIDLALHESASPVPLSSIAVRHQISLSYLEQMFSKLRQDGLVESTRGPGGGYTLGRSADAITVADIIGAIESGTDVVGLGTAQQGDPLAQDMAQELWDALNSKMVDYMQSINLRSLASEQRAKGFRVEERKPVKHGVARQPKPEPMRTTAPNSVFALGQFLLARG